MKKHVCILKQFSNYRSKTTTSQNQLFSISKGCDSKFVCSVRRLMFVNICMKFRVDILLGFQGTERTRTNSCFPDMSSAVYR